jgi:hypothetical protein
MTYTVSTTVNIFLNDADRRCLGKCISVSDYFHWINTAETKGNFPGGGSYAEDLALVGTENFIAMDYLIKIAKRSLSERDNIYYNNAAALADN